MICLPSSHSVSLTFSINVSFLVELMALSESIFKLCNNCRLGIDSLVCTPLQAESSTATWAHGPSQTCPMQPHRPSLARELLLGFCICSNNYIFKLGVKSSWSIK